MDILNGIPAAAQPFFWPILGVVCIVMALAALVSFNNPGLRTAIKEHVLWIIVAGVLMFGGAGLLTNFLRSAGAH